MNIVRQSLLLFFFLIYNTFAFCPQRLSTFRLSAQINRLQPIRWVQTRSCTIWKASSTDDRVETENSRNVDEEKDTKQTDVAHQIEIKKKELKNSQNQIELYRKEIT